MERLAGVTESPEVLSVEDLRERFRDAGPKEIAKAQKLGLLVPIADGLYEAPSPPCSEPPKKSSLAEFRARPH
jgi:hypothetical protein